MVRIALFLLIFFAFPFLYADELDVDRLVFYLQKFQYGKKLKSISFKNKELNFFRFINLLNKREPDIYSIYTKRIAKKIQATLFDNRCTETPLNAILKLVKKNENNVLKVVYFFDPYNYYYSNPIRINGCNLILVYKKKILLKKTPISGAGYLFFLKLEKNEFTLFRSIRFFYID